MAFEYLPEEVRALIGVETEPKPAPVAVERALIDHWVEVYEDANPLYSDEQYAKQSKYGSIVAPPGMLQSWTFPFHWTPATGPVDREKGQLGIKLKRLLDVPTGILTDSIMEWYVPIRLGDHLTYSEVLAHVSPKKKTAVGVGYFCTIDVLVRNQEDDLVGKMTKTTFNFRREE